MQASPQFRDGLFRNPSNTSMGVKKGHRLEVGREYFFGKAVRRPPRPLAAQDPRFTWARPNESGFRATWLGHSTVLLEMDGLRVLTDPVWSARISPFGLLAPKRFQPVPVRVKDLPKLDAIVISHDHFDHLDHGTVLQLIPLGVPFVTPLGVGKYLQAWGVPAAQIRELDWWESLSLGDLTLTATPSQHFSGRVGGRNATLWASFVIQSPKRKVFFSGDTALTSQFEEVGKRLGPFDLVMGEVGGFHEAWDHVHMGPHNALEAHRMLGGGLFMPVHWGTFNLALHAWDWPAETLYSLATERNIDIVLPPLGVAFEPDRRMPLEPWWREGVTATTSEPLDPTASPSGAAGPGRTPTTVAAV